jgi:cold shock CspA family protein
MNDSDNVEMHGTVAQWDGRFGYILTDDGERVSISQSLLIANGHDETPKVGDRITFLASKRVEISYHLEEIHAYRVAKADKANLRRLHELNRTIALRRNPREREMIDLHYAEDFTGTLESFNATTGTGIIRCATGPERISVHICSLRAAGFKTAELGSTLSFNAVEQSDGWRVFRVHWLEPPDPR